jgi:opacity protein-like surface antigen
MRSATLLLLLGVAAAPALAADDSYRVKLLLGGGYQLGTQEFSQTISFDQFLEKATIATSYTADKAPGIDVGIQFNAFKHVGLSVAGTLYDRDLKAAYNASFPHPLFFDKARAATGSLSGKQKEAAGHVNLVVFGHSGALDLSAWAGVSLFKVEADVLENVVYSQSYPYDSVTVTSTPQTKVNDSPIGFNVGASVDWRFAKNVGFGIQGRYARAKAKFTVTNAPTVEVDAGGFQAGAGIRFYF